MVDDRPRRRQCVRAAGLALIGALAGCAGALGGDPGGERGGRPVDLSASEVPPCAAGVSVTEEAARIETGTVPEVRFRLRNDGDAPVRYELLVVFEQGTSLGIEARTGRTVLAGTLGPGETVSRTATVDSRDARNTDGYDLRVSLACPS